MTRHPYRVSAVAGALLGLLPAAAIAQQGTTISGTVTASDNHAPLQGVSVAISGLGLGVLTDAQGHYSFTVSAARARGQQQVTLTARRIGFQPQSRGITLAGGTMNEDFSLVAAPTELTGIVVTALGIEKEKKALGVAQQTLDSTVLTQNARTTNFVSDLSGKIAGINVTSATTEGGSARIVIRGANSIGGNNQPLFVVDGIPIDNSNFANGTEQRGYGGYDYGNTAQDINPDDIATVSVLKGPNAAAL